MIHFLHLIYNRAIRVLILSSKFYFELHYDFKVSNVVSQLLDHVMYYLQPLFCFVLFCFLTKLRNRFYRRYCELKAKIESGNTHPVLIPPANNTNTLPMRSASLKEKQRYDRKFEYDVRYSRRVSRVFCVPFCVTFF